jgi:hypothetical protein
VEVGQVVVGVPVEGVVKEVVVAGADQVAEADLGVVVAMEVEEG